MAGNSNLNSAKSARKDEFYTQLSDIEKELRHYKQHFKGKTVMCNCDDPFESNFFKYFVLNFNRIGLKKLIATCYTGSPIANQQLSIFDILGETKENQNKPYKAVVTTVYDKTGDGGVDMIDVAELFKSGENELSELQGNGDFRSKECLELMDEADIVVTNPPFSLFREYIATLMEYEKKFIIIGNQNAITYKEIFPLLMTNKIWLGVSMNGSNRYFEVPDDYPLLHGKVEDGKKFAFVKGCRWFTNLDIKKRHETMILVKRYSPEEYPSYDNYDAIEVSSSRNIPFDYSGIMGVPITFLEKYNPDQFEIVGITDRDNLYGLTTRIYTKEDTPRFGDCNRRATIRMDDGSLKSTYARLLIRNKHPEEAKS